MKKSCIMAFAGGMIILFSSCAHTDSINKTDGSENLSYTRDVFAMDTFMSMKAYGSNAEKGLEASENRILAIEKELSVTLDESCISRLNRQKKANVSDAAAAIINKAIETGDRTNGALDITLYPVLVEWGFTTGNYKIPDHAELESLLEDVDYRKINIVGNEVSISSEQSIDLGALAKGYTSDVIMEELKKSGVTSAIVSLGGNVQALGTKPDGSLWKVAVRDPFNPETDACVLEVGEKAVITSGNYERFFTGDDGKNYWHIIDPKDGYPADNGIVSATVVGDSGIDCDALSTALFVMGYDKAVEIWNKEKNFDMVLITDSGKIFYTEGLRGYLTNVSSMAAEVIEND